MDSSVYRISSRPIAHAFRKQFKLFHCHFLSIWKEIVLPLPPGIFDAERPQPRICGPTSQALVFQGMQI